LDISSRRLPPRRDVLLAFSACAFPIHAWALIGLFREIPAWIERGHVVGEMLGIASYTLMYALLESILLLVLLTLAAAILPQRLLRRKFVAQVTMFVLLTSAFAALAQFNIIHWWQFRQLVFWLIQSAVLLVSAVAIINRSDRVEVALCSAASRLSVLAWLYLSMSLLGTLVVLVRLMFGGR